MMNVNIPVELSFAIYCILLDNFLAWYCYMHVAVVSLHIHAVQTLKLIKLKDLV